MGITRGLSFVLQFRLLRTEGVVSFCWGSGLVCSLKGTLAADLRLRHNLFLSSQTTQFQSRLQTISITIILI